MRSGINEYSKSNPQTIEELFDKIAPQYDRANAIMSLNLHKTWNRQLVQAALGQQSPHRYLDLCSGTGAISFLLLEQVKEPLEAFLLDFSENMLAAAKKKEQKLKLPHSIHYLKADAQNIPLPRESIDAVTIAYGIRNVQSPSLCFESVFRVLRKGGTFSLLELTTPKNPLLRFGHSLYTTLFLPAVGKIVASDRQAYRYLRRSIQEFLSPQKLAELLQEQGFQEVSVNSLSCGIASLITAKKC